MRRRASSGLQQSLLQPASAPSSPASASSSGRGPPRFPRAQPPASPAGSRQTRSEWWAALQLPANAGKEQLETLARRALTFTPRVSLAPPDAVLLELRGSVRLFGGVEALVAALGAAFPSPHILSMACTPFAALVFARCGVPARHTDAARLVSDLAPLPLKALRWPEETLQRLAAVGVTTIGAALRLPRAGFARRFGTLALTALDRLLGRQGDPRQGWAPAERFRRRFDPEMELTDQAAVLAVLEPLCAELEDFLRTRQRGITSLALQLTHRGHAPTRQVLRMAAPAQHASQILALLELQFGQVALPAPVRRCELRSGPLVEIAAESTALWHPGEHGGGRAAAQMPAFIEQLRARLGNQAVSGLALATGHRPERLSLSTSPLLEDTKALARQTHERMRELPWKAAHRPLWLLSVPVPLAEAAGWPCRDGHRLQLLAGPERVESGWWDGGDIERDYYQAQDAAGAKLWIFRDRAVRRRWFLHGFFG